MTVSRRRSFAGWVLSGDRFVQRALQLVLRAGVLFHVALYRFTGGGLGGRLPGAIPVLLLTTVGRKTGRRRTVPVAYTPYLDGFLVIAGSAGSGRHPAWFNNLQQTPVVDVQAGRRRVACDARIAQGAERAALWERALREWPVVVDYQAQAGREVPFVHLAPRAGGTSG